MGPTAQADGLGDAPEVVIHDHHVGGFHGRIGAGAAHGKADVGLGQGRRIVDAVAGHGGGAMALTQFLDRRELVLGQQATAHLGDAGLAAHGLCRGNVVAREHHGHDAQLLKALYGVDRTGLDGVGHGEDAQDAVLIGQEGDRAALRFVAGEFALQAGIGLLALLDQAVVAQHQALAFDDAFYATAEQRLERVHVRHRTVEAGRDGLGNRVVRARSQALGPAFRLRFGGWARWHERHELRLAFGQRAGLVQRDRFQVPGFLQVGAALDQDAAPGGGGQPADHRHRRGDDQRARAGDHQQHERLVDGRHPGPVEQQRRQHRHRQRQCEHGRGVDRGEAVHEALRGRAGALRFFDRMNDACERRIAGRCRHLELEFAVLVDGAREHQIARFLVHRNALARNRRLVDAAVALGHAAVERDALAGLDPGDGVQGDVRGLHALPASIGLLDVGLVRCQVHQALDGVARPVHGACLDQFGDGVQRHDHGRLGPLADEKGARDGHRHQRIDVELAAPQRDQALGVGLDARQPDRHGSDGHAQALPHHRVRCEVRHALGHDRQTQRCGQPHIAGTLGMVMPMVVGGTRCGGSARRHRLRRETGLADRHQRGFHGRVGAIDAQVALGETEVQATDAVDGFDRAADLGLLHRAIHGRDAEGVGCDDLGRTVLGRRERRGCAARIARGVGRCARAARVVGLGRCLRCAASAFRLRSRAGHTARINGLFGG